ncbi:hypothetical protein GGI42DRAFT_63255 [Trichoderma sp. SZMC 28013]
MASRPFSRPSWQQITSHRCHKWPLLAQHLNPHHFRVRPELPLRLRPWRRDLIRVAHQASRLQRETYGPVNKLRMPLLMYELILVYIML